MAILGVRAAVDLALPTGIDGSEVFKFEVFRTRLAASSVIAEAAAVIGSMNERIAAKYGDIMYITESMYGITRQGESSRSMTPLGVEFADSDPVRSDIIGHMLPLAWYQDALGWTEQYLMNASEEQILADVQLISERWLNRFDYQFITRILTNTENAIGSAGYDVGWAIGDAGENVSYIPPQWMGTVFSSTHTHYEYADDSSVDYDTLFENMVTELRHHGYEGRLLCLTSEADIDEITVLSNFVAVVPSEIQVADQAAAPTYIMRGQPFEGVPGQLYGLYKSKRGLVELRYHERIPTNYCWMTKPMGRLNAGNGVAVRTFPGESFGMMVDPQLTRSINPKLDQVNFKAQFGVGVNNRLNGVAGYINAGAGAWVNPTIS